MDPEKLQELLPDVGAGALSHAVEHPDVRAAVDDLEIALAQIGRCERKPQDRADWEATRDELLTEIRRLTVRLHKAP